MARTRTRTLRNADPWSDAVEHLRSVDPAYWNPVIERVGPCLLRPRPDRFGTLVRAIVGQQISSKAAAAINLRLHAVSGDPHTPEALIALGHDKLRGVGTSAVKARYILNLAEAVARGDVPLHEFDRWDDEAIVSSLTTIKGIGAWTAEMFLIFALNRPDVLPVSDLGVRVGIRNYHGLAELPTPGECRELTESWRPYRSIASWYLWRQSDLPKVQAED
jgi:3-methyladenine DNA glycosylase/8-oxoguanine DNA glycosylase